MATTYRLYAGAYTGNSGGIGVHALKFENDILHVTSSDDSLTNPSYVLPAGDKLYAVEETLGKAAVAVFHLDPEGNLERPMRYEIPGSLLCHICACRQFLYASNYLAGSLVCVRMPDGHLCDVIQHEGHGANPIRQGAPHIHSALPSPDDQRLLVADLGLDRLFQYKIGQNGELTPWAIQPWVEVAPGQGPRHFAFHPNGEWLYLITEMGKNIWVFRHNKDNGVLEHTATHSLRKVHCPPEALAADVHLTADGRYLYASVRESDRIFCFAVKNNGATLEYSGDFDCGGNGPRSFDLSLDGKYIAVANTKSGNLAMFPLDKKTGALGQLKAETDIPSLSCVKWADKL